MRISPSALFHRLNPVLLGLLGHYGVWGIGALAAVDMSSIPLPIPIDILLIGVIAHNHASALPYCFMAALGSAIGGLVPFYLGRAGGELFLMKRVNRQRYEQLRDRFESQEFFAILVPSFLPPPMPVKLFLFAAGVFEMKTIWFFIAVFTGKFVRFLIWALITIFYGPAIVHEIYAHPGYVLAVIGIILGLVIFYAVRKLRGRRDSESPAEDRTPDN